MKFNRIVVLLLLLAVLPLNADLVPAPGSQYAFIGTGVREFSLGFSGYSAFGGFESISFNPAAAGGLKRLANMLTLGGIGSDNTYIAAGVAVPTDSGVFSFSGSFLNGSSTNAFDNLINLSIGVSKPITDKLYWGFNIKGFRAEHDPTAWSAVFDMGILYMDPSGKEKRIRFS